MTGHRSKKLFSRKAGPQCYHRQESVFVRSGLDCGIEVSVEEPRPSWVMQSTTLRMETSSFSTSSALTVCTAPTWIDGAAGAQGKVGIV